jgi:hypothetical protein
MKALLITSALLAAKPFFAAACVRYQLRVSEDGRVLENSRDDSARPRTRG